MMRLEFAGNCLAIGDWQSEIDPDFLQPVCRLDYDGVFYNEFFFDYLKKEIKQILTLTEQPLLHSALKKIGRAELWEKIDAVL